MKSFSDGVEDLRRVLDLGRQHWLLGAGASLESGSVTIKFPQQLSMLIMRMIKRDIEPTLHVPVHQLVRILDVTKTKIMGFAMDLEARGILGEGIRFSKAEEQLAQSITHNTINIQRMDNSQIQQSTNESGQSTSG